MKNILTLALAASLPTCAPIAAVPALAVMTAGCATIGDAPARAAALDRAYAAFTRVKLAAAIAAPFLPPELQATIAAATARAEQAFAAARAAETLIEAAEQLRIAEDAATDIVAVVAAGQEDAAIAPLGILRQI